MKRKKAKEPGKRRRGRGKWWKQLLIVLLCILTGLNIYHANAGGLLGDRLPMPLGFGVSVVMSGSMEPALMTGDLILIKSTQDFSPGDMVVYQSERMLIVHRLLALQDGMAITRGDANAVDDEPFPAEQLRGVVIGRLPGMGRLVQLLRTPAAGLCMLALAVWLTEVSLRGKKQQDESHTRALRAEIARLRAELSVELRSELAQAEVEENAEEAAGDASGREIQED